MQVVGCGIGNCLCSQCRSHSAIGSPLPSRFKRRSMGWLVRVCHFPAIDVLFDGPQPKTCI